MKTVLRMGAMAAALTLLAASPLAAQYRINPNAPIGVASDQLEHSSSNCSDVLTGSVEITQDRTRLRANTVRVINQRSGGECRTRVDRMEASGNVFYVTPDRSVRADSAVYNVQGSEAVFSGNVIAVQGRDVSTADRMVINLDTNAVTATGRVRGVIYPEESSGQAR